MIFCTNCEKLVLPTKNIEKETNIIKGVEVTAEIEKVFCKECKEPLVDEKLRIINDTIIKEKYLEITNTISSDDIREKILKKYDISATTLAKVLGWGEATIHRYVGGAIPKLENGIKLNSLVDPFKMQELIYNNKDRISKTSLNKVKIGIKNAFIVISQTDDFKVLKAIDVAKYFIKNYTNMVYDKMWFHKILAFTQSWHLSFYDKIVFHDDILAYKHGPIIKDVLYKTSYWTNEHFPSEKFITDAKQSTIELCEKQIKLLDEIYNNYGGYQARILRNMSHDSLWEKHYENDGEAIPVYEIRDYYNSMRKIMNVSNISDIKYAAEMQYQRRRFD